MSLTKSFEGWRIRFMCVAAAIALACISSIAAAADPLKIGFGMSLTGPNAGAGRMALLALEVWRDETNGAGGLLGRQVQLVYYDDQSNPALVPGIYQKLLNLDKIDLALSPFGTNQIVPALPVAMEKGMVLMSLFGTGVNDTVKYPRYFQILPNGPEGNASLSRGFFEAALKMSPKPMTVALAGEDTEFGQHVLSGARENIQRLGLRIVYDQQFPPNLPDHSTVISAIEASKPDIVFVASYPNGSVGMVRALRERNYGPRMFGGAMIGLQFTPIKAQLGPLLDGIVVNENYVPEPTMNFPGVDSFLKRYRERAPAAKVDPLGFWAPFAYAEAQILAAAVTAVGEVNQSRIADYIHRTVFQTVVGEVQFSEIGEWKKSRILFVQYRHLQRGDVAQFRQPGRAVIIYPPELKSGELVYPLEKASSS
jgi:branched-chain amino acid transport system substrate-binding protein